MSALAPGLDALRQLGEELRATFAEERAAIARLDHHRLAELVDVKRRIADDLVAARADVAPCPEVHDLFVAIQAEAHATAMLAAAATEAVRALLGDEPAGYDRKARSVTGAQLRLLATY